MANPTTALVEALAAHLEDIEGLTVHRSWPGANQPLEMPSVTITAGTPAFRNGDPYLLSKADADDENKAVVKRVVGQYDIQIQLDLWAANKVERSDQFERLFSHLNPDVTPMGLRLQLDEYHDVWACLALVAYQDVDDEAAAQRQEWRAKLDLVATVDAVLTKMEYMIGTIENQLSTPDTI